MNMFDTIIQASIFLVFIHNTQSLVPDQISFLPLLLKCNSITQSYPITLLSKLFSSVPKRQYALQDINVSFGDTCLPEDDVGGIRSNFCLLVGRSASGKSSLLRIISGQERPVSGNVLINDISLYPPLQKDVDQFLLTLPTPIIVDSKPDCFDDQYTVLQRIENSATNERVDAKVRYCLALKIAKILNLSESQLSGYSSSLSPSGQYLFGLACAAVASCHSTIVDGAESSHPVNVFPPILLLDELLDSETSIVAAKVGEGVANLARIGAIIICATHRHQYLVDYANRMITLSGGKLLKDEDFMN